MNEYEFQVEIYAVKSLRVKANTFDEADKKADLIVSSETIPVTQEDIVQIYISDAYMCVSGEDSV